MNYILLFLSIFAAIGACLASQSQTDPSVQIDWNQSIGSQIHGVTNGDEAQDVITVSQWNLSPSGYATVAPYGSGERADYYCDGSGDNATLQEAIDDGYYTGRYNSVKLLIGNYNFSQDAQLDMRGNMMLYADTKPMYGTSQVINTTYPQEARIHYNATDTSPIRLRNNTIVKNIQFYDDRQNLAGSTIVDDPAVFLADTGSLSYNTERAAVLSCHFVNSARWFNGSVCSDVVINDCSGYPLKTGIYIYWSGHGTYITNNHWLPSYTGTSVSATIQNEVAANGIGVRYFGLGGHINNNNAWNFGNPIQVFNVWPTQSGEYEITGNMFDACRIPISVDGTRSAQLTGNFALSGQGVWTGGNFAVTYPNESYSMVILNSSSIAIGNNAVSGGNGCYYLSNSSASITGGTCDSWALSTGGQHSAIEAWNSRIIASGVLFIAHYRADERAVFLSGCDDSVLSAMNNCNTLGALSLVLYSSNITASGLRFNSLSGAYLSDSTINTTNEY